MRHWILAVLIGLATAFGGTAMAQQSINFEQFDPIYQPLEEAFRNGDHKAAQRVAEGLGATAW